MHICVPISYQDTETVLGNRKNRCTPFSGFVIQKLVPAKNGFCLLLSTLTSPAVVDKLPRLWGNDWHHLRDKIALVTMLQS